MTTSNDTLMEQALALHRRDELEGARALFEQVLAADPRHAGALHALGVIRAQGGDAAAALDCFDRAIALDPGHDMAYFNRGHALVELGRLDEAIRSYERALEIRPGFAGAQANLAALMKRAGRRDALSMAVAETVAGWSAEACQQQGVRLLDQGRKAMALAYFDQALEKSPGLAEAHCCRGIALKELGQAERAIAAYRRSIELKPGLAQAHYNLAMILH